MRDLEGLEVISRTFICSQMWGYSAGKVKAEGPRVQGHLGLQKALP